MMLEALRRKSAQLTRDPILRRWLFSAVIGRSQRPKSYVRGQPPYIADEMVSLEEDPAEQRVAVFEELQTGSPETPITLHLPGETLTIAASDAASVFTRSFDDIETLLALHRFAWVPLAGKEIDCRWVDILWRAWIDGFETVDESWAWHPYTAAERAINILDFAHRFGLPGTRDRTIAVLAQHAFAIARRLEYFGDQGTGNHLSNNGRGLYILGLALGLESSADMGGKILLAEAQRLFGPSGMLREGSTHYHLLLTRNYASAWFHACRHGRPEAAALEAIVLRALGAVSALDLPGRLPLIGDISPDCPPEFLACLLPGGDLNHGWGGLLSDDNRRALYTLKQSVCPVSPDILVADGWVRSDSGSWACLLHAPPDGWPPIPGHAHQDMSSFELHHNGVPLFIDPGRGSYRTGGKGVDYTAGSAHNALLVDGKDPYPANKPYYADNFRRKIAGGPRITRTRDGLTITHAGFSRIAGVGEAARTLTFADGTAVIADRIVGQGRHKITRRLHTPLKARQDGDGVILENPSLCVRLRADADICISEGKYWTAYGTSETATVIDMTSTELLPARLRMSIETVSPVS